MIIHVVGIVGLTAIGVAFCGCGPRTDESSPATRLPNRTLAAQVEGAEEVFGGSAFRGRATYEVDVPAGVGRLVLHLYQTVNAPDFHVDVVARREVVRRPIGTRYLAADDFGAFEVYLETPTRGRHPGEVEAFDVQLDALSGVTYATMRLRFDEVEGSDAPVEVNVDLEGFSRIYCLLEGRRASELDPRWPDVDEPPECAAVFDAIRATPDDPNAPPPPYDLDVDDTPGDGSDDVPLLD